MQTLERAERLLEANYRVIAALQAELAALHGAAGGGVGVGGVGEVPGGEAGSAVVGGGAPPTAEEIEAVVARALPLMVGFRGNVASFLRQLHALPAGSQYPPLPVTLNTGLIVLGQQLEQQRRAAAATAQGPDAAGDPAAAAGTAAPLANGA